jgi:hypothetical protein
MILPRAYPYVLSNPAGATTFSATGVNYDIAIAGLPFFIGATDDSPYRRVTAQYRKQQYDQTREAVSNHLLVGGLDLNLHSTLALVLNTLSLLKMSRFAFSIPSLKV